MSWKTEFPDYDGDFICPDGWTDASWHNDTCPHIEKRVNDIVIAVFQDYVDEDRREPCWYNSKRYTFMLLANSCEVFVYKTDDWSEIEKLMEGVRT